MSHKIFLPGAPLTVSSCRSSWKVRHLPEPSGILTYTEIKHKEATTMADMSNFFGLGNHGQSTVAEGYDTKSREIVKLGDAAEQRIYGYIISKEGKTQKGKTLPPKVLLCGEKELVSLPERYTEIYRGFNEEQLALITSGRVFLTDITPISTKNGDTFVFKLQTRDD